ncbi:hypothetical protein DFH09DRAFT_1101715 [Mycena vulgaris]|nr:hypothetical protein DFH09DRAFT_1101715 [Mycena vulgaris]
MMLTELNECGAAKENSIDVRNIPIEGNRTRGLRKEQGRLNTNHGNGARVAVTAQDRREWLGQLNEDQGSSTRDFTEKNSQNKDNVWGRIECGLGKWQQKLARAEMISPEQLREIALASVRMQPQENLQN